MVDIKKFNVETSHEKQIKIRDDAIETMAEIANFIKEVVTSQGTVVSIESSKMSMIKMVWPTLDRVIMESLKLDALKVKSSTDIVTLVAAGKISYAQAKDLISLLKDLKDLKLDEEMDGDLDE